MDGMDLRHDSFYGDGKDESPIPVTRADDYYIGELPALPHLSEDEAERLAGELSHLTDRRYTDYDAAVAAAKRISLLTLLSVTVAPRIEFYDMEPFTVKAGE